MKKLFRAAGMITSAACLAGMIYVGWDAQQHPAHAAADPTQAIGGADYLEMIRPRPRPSLWQRSSDEERHCMAQNIYFESRGEPILGQMAVAWVTINRMTDSRWPDTICDVVWQDSQFSWTHDGRSDTPRDQTAWAVARAVAELVMRTAHRTDTDVTEGATHFHADYVSPYWADDFEQTATIGVHVFYRADL